MVLLTIASLSISRKALFEPYLKSFYVRSGDPRFIRLLKLEILTSIANESNISSVLREFQQYVRADDKVFATATIQCIGRCASRLPNVTESCLSGLMILMSKKDEAVVAESVVVIKKLLQLNPEAHKEIIVMMAKMSNSITVPMARASILWLIGKCGHVFMIHSTCFPFYKHVLLFHFLISLHPPHYYLTLFFFLYFCGCIRLPKGEYSSHVPKIAPDVLRQLAITFADEEDIVKLQVLNLAAKLFLTNHKQVAKDNYPLSILF